MFEMELHLGVVLGRLNWGLGKGMNFFQNYTGIYQHLINVYNVLLAFILALLMIPYWF